MKINKSDWQVVIDECEKQFGLMDETTKNMEIARQCQQTTYEYAKNAIKSAPEAPVEEKEIPVGVA